MLRLSDGLHGRDRLHERGGTRRVHGPVREGSLLFFLASYLACVRMCVLRLLVFFLPLLPDASRNFVSSIPSELFGWMWAGWGEVGAQRKRKKTTETFTRKSVRCDRPQLSLQR